MPSSMLAWWTLHCMQAAFAIWWQGTGAAAGTFGQVPAASVAWDGSVYVVSAALHTAGVLELFVQHRWQNLANSPLSFTVQPGPLAAALVSSWLRACTEALLRIGCCLHQGCILSYHSRRGCLVLCCSAVQCSSSSCLQH